VVITAVREWRTDYRRPISILIYGTIIFWVGPIFVLGYPACQTDYRQPSYVLLSNFVCFGLIQLTAQWFSFLDEIPALNKIMFTAEAIKKFTFVQWGIIFGIVGLIGGLISWQFYLLYAIGRLGAYLGTLIGCLLLFSLITYSLRHHYYLHFHHYSVGLLVPFFPVPSLISSIAQAILVGICIEGLSRWGPDPFFIPHHKPTETLIPSSPITPSTTSYTTNITVAIPNADISNNNNIVVTQSPLEWGTKASSK